MYCCKTGHFVSALLTLLFVTLAGCGGSEPAGDGTAAPPAAASVQQDELPLEVTAADDAPDADATGSDAEKWGDLRMKFVFGGAAPVQAPIALAQSDEYCSKTPVIEESLVVDKATGGLANVVVSLYLGRGESIETHPQFASQEATVLTNRNCRFEPHAFFHVAGKPLTIANADTTRHNANANFGSSKNRSFNETIAASGKITRDGLTDPLRWPAKISCSMHTWMAAYVLIQDHPYGAVSNQQGELVISNLPVGEHTIQIWHERTGELSDIKIDGDSFSWRKGRVKVNIRPGVNTAPVVTIPAASVDG